MSFERLQTEIARQQDREGDDDALAAAIKLRLARPRRPQRRWFLWTLVIAAPAALAIFLVGREPVRAPFGFVAGDRPGRTGQLLGNSDGPTTLAFSDGSRIELGARGSLHVRQMDDARVVLDLHAGELRAFVATSPRRWTLHARAFTLRVLGARFELRWQEGDRVMLAVDEGRVNVEGAGPTRTIEARATLVLEPPAPPAPPPTVAPAVRSRPTTPRRSANQPQDLLRVADEARAAGRSDDAARALSRFVSDAKGDARVPVAWFTLGRVEAERGRHAAAADAFARAASFGRKLAVLEDAMAAVASSWARAGQPDRAKAAAAAYLQAFPSGAYGAKMSAIRDHGVFAD